ncbi:hypothetical protein PBY51_008843 [Eleginops maclovinus]|uniref:Uncharacterized protein n=1 Tax=Eleginops maclovinus TaxID=56733 RepID=A0AAN7WTD4_ELEMC|nr:hypothetical protein PBY51_008843 [Eleginops maclovinus]
MDRGIPQGGREGEGRRTAGEREDEGVADRLKYSSDPSRGASQLQHEGLLMTEQQRREKNAARVRWGWRGVADACLLTSGSNKDWQGCGLGVATPEADNTDRTPSTAGPAL